MKKRQAGFSLIELLVVVGIVLVLVALAIPSYLKARGVGNDASTAATLHAIGQAQNIYQSQYGQGYAVGLANLGGTPGAAGTCAAAQDFDNNSVVAMGVTPFTFKGAIWTYTPTGTAIAGAGPCNGTNLTPGFVLTAVPTSPTNGTRSMCIDESLTLHYDVALSKPITEATCEALPTMGN